MHLLLRLFLVPAALIGASVWLQNAVQTASESRYLTGLAGQLMYLPIGVVVIALIAVLRNIWRVWRAVHGHDEQACLHCSMPTTYHERGRYGPYYKCWSCGANRADRY